MDKLRRLLPRRPAEPRGARRLPRPSGRRRRAPDGVADARSSASELGALDGAGDGRPRPGRPDGRSSADQLRAPRPDLDWTGRERMRGDEPMGSATAPRPWRSSPTSRTSRDRSPRTTTAPRLADVDEEAVRRALGRQAVDDLDQLRRVERELEAQGYLTRRDGGLELTAKAVRRLGRTALRTVFAVAEGRRSAAPRPARRRRLGRPDRRDPARGSSVTSSPSTSCAR